ncbi:hypothetical protein PCH_Pc21g12710 [Penicillium rubens Wisconsin 54-1255]|uniref:Uncharacterized protein n=1 Tax=Penicillium rubens (strain ATCC 28089 / DSM 1075 / NRRL 1951 / Wisconsin 54-1255) TaxID=500485 RepID=B6HM11_PENRW|nr:hypothetical protein PCH_Pc21g12710 [Penicillium rubens Wisconsin 54-1255]
MFTRPIGPTHGTDLPEKGLDPEFFVRVRKELDRRALQVPCMLGESLALKSAYNSGTLGGLLELKMPGKADYITVGLTCFHCVSPSEKVLDPDFLARVRVWRKEGIVPADNLRTRLQVKHPSPNAIKSKIASVEDEICGIEHNEEYARLCDLVNEGLQGQLGRRAEETFLGITKNLSELRSFLREMEKFRGNFGSAFAASGFRTTEDEDGNSSDLTNRLSALFDASRNEELISEMQILILIHQKLFRDLGLAKLTGLLWRIAYLGFVDGFRYAACRQRSVRGGRRSLYL